MNEPGLMFDGRPVAIVEETEEIVKVSDGHRSWWEPKENVKKI